MAITNLEDFKRYGAGQEVTLPGFLPDAPITVRLRRISVMGLAQAGTIPNPLLSAAAKLFKDGLNLESTNSGEQFKDMADVMAVIAKESLQEPTYAELEAAGVALTDTQLLYIYNFSQTGVDALKSFREQPAGDLPDSDGKDVPGKTKRAVKR